MQRQEYMYDDQLRRLPLQCQFVRSHPNARVPTRAHHGDAGYDLYACEQVIIPAGDWADVPVGLAIEPAPGYWMRLVGRSSTFRRRRQIVIEGIVDNGYRGDIYFGVWNTTDATVTIEIGERIAQAIFGPIITFDWIEVDILGESDRGVRGFGSTGA